MINVVHGGGGWEQRGGHDNSLSVLDLTGMIDASFNVTISGGIRRDIGIHNIKHVRAGGKSGPVAPQPP